MENTTQEILLSVIVPVYNVESFLEDCINSIEKIQTPKEIICINDGSTDQSLAILEQLAKQYEDVVVVNQENQGVSATRNNGIALAKGKYLCFFDSDDMVIPETMDKAICLLEKGNLDCVAYGYQTVEEACRYEDFLCEPQPEESTVSYDKQLLYSKDYVWSMMMKKEIIDQHAITFPGMKYFEDQCFTREYCSYCDRAAVLSDVGHLYRMRTTSAMHNPNRYKPWTMDAIKGAVHAKKVEERATDPVFKKQCKNAKQLLILHAMTMGMMVKEFTARDIFEELKKNGLYPVKPMWRMLLPNGKCTPLNYLRFGFFCRWYYGLFFTVTRKLRKIK
jgi:glycosyltransferase involved in cell wall biosynthesis